MKWVKNDITQQNEELQINKGLSNREKKKLIVGKKMIDSGRLKGGGVSFAKCVQAPYDGGLGIPDIYLSVLLGLSTDNLLFCHRHDPVVRVKLDLLEPCDQHAMLYVVSVP